MKMFATGRIAIVNPSPYARAGALELRLRRCMGAGEISLPPSP